MCQKIICEPQCPNHENSKFEYRHEVKLCANSKQYQMTKIMNYPAAELRGILLIKQIQIARTAEYGVNNVSNI